MCKFTEKVIIIFSVNLVETSRKEATIQEIEAKFTYCQAICNRITLVLGIAILPAGSDIRRISDPSGSVLGTNLYPRVLPHTRPVIKLGRVRILFFARGLPVDIRKN